MPPARCASLANITLIKNQKTNFYSEFLPFSIVALLLLLLSSLEFLSFELQEAVVLETDVGGWGAIVTRGDIFECTSFSVERYL